MTTDVHLYRRSLSSCLLFLLGSAFSCQSPRTPEAAPPAPATRFTAVPAAESGVDFVNALQEDDTFNLVDFYYVYNGGGVAVGDLNNDGLPDLFFTGNRVPNRLYLNQGDFRFKDITASAGIQPGGWSTGATMVDLNGDGLLDLYVCRSGNYPAAQRTNQLYLNQGDLTFREVAASWGLADTTHTNQAAFFDYDRDGDLDAYLMTSTNAIRNPNKLTPLKEDGTGLSVDKLLRNDGGTFVDVSHAAGIRHDGFGLGLAVCDLNGDGWEDVWVSNDFLANDHLYVNNQDGTFTESAKAYFRHHAHFAMGNDVGDVNNDGLPDALVVDMLPSDPVDQKKMAGPVNPHQFETMVRAGYHPQYMRNMFYLNLGHNGPRPVFAEIGQQLGLHQTDWSWAPLWVDVDLDGWQDLLITNGYLRDITDMDFIVHNSQVASSGDVETTNRVMREGATQQASIPRQNRLFRNQRGERFEDQSAALGMAPSFSNGAAYADLDGDGDPDLIINNLNAPATLLRNTTTSAAFLKVQLAGPPQNTKGLGSEVTIYTDGMPQTRHVAVTRGYQSSVDYTLLFGLGDHAGVDSLVVRWPDGRWEVQKHVPVNQTLTVRYEDSRTEPYASSSPPVPQWQEVAAARGLTYVHQEEFYMDYDVEPLLPHKLSEQGPCLAVGDVNGDGREDLFVGGSYRHAGTLFLQEAAGTFRSRALDPAPDKQEEDVDAALFDADGDGDLDLYIVGGSNEFPDGSPYFQDRLYMNDGRGNFRLDRNRLPEIRHSGGCVAVADVDHDGDLDLFRGGRLVPLAFPQPGVSALLVNQGGTFTEQTDSLAPGLSRVGMVTDACWADVDGDGWDDLVVVGEYMPLTIYRNDRGRLQPMDAATRRETNGLWNCVAAADVDGDGDLDLLAGNLGLNTRYQCSPQQPMSVYGGDFDGNGRWDAIPAYYEDGQEYPTPPLFDLVRQIPVFKKRYQRFDSYAQTTLPELLAPVRNQVRSVARAYEQRSGWFENQGDRRFVFHPFPAAAQRAPVNDLLLTTSERDSSAELWLIGNDHSVEPVEGQHDGGVGLLLRGDGTGQWEPVPPRQSGFWVEGVGRRVAPVATPQGPLLIVVQNQGPLRAFARTEPPDPSYALEP
ncbi:Repeat domain-containing protein [Catalinimonas alkaloidigena]|uniref:Repeat domain-containing protein n=1 Tax=Catalinimonas alkaloidigena TaxID=1075417 RepID=A0A1G8Y6N7_9BACT|nr:VCBS repeat-containing protein [Catalinimonas alkaloidigena]SDJ98421.1 Repeat domain-containing protein [Catalinimonas alkaloidigena]